MKYTNYRSVIALRTNQAQFGGRNEQGKITVRHRGGGHKQAFRQINWNRPEIKGIVVAFEYDPQRNAPLVKLFHKETASYSYILAPQGIKPFHEVVSYPKLANKSTDIYKLLNLGDSAPLSFFEMGDFIHAVEAFPGQGALFSRAAGTFCQIMSVKSEDKVVANKYATIRLPSGNQRHISLFSRASFGVVTSGNYYKKSLEKAGRSRWLGWRPSVRGVAINPVDHPHGGGQGKTSGGRPSVTFKAWPTKGKPTRHKKRHSKFILKVRKI